MIHALRSSVATRWWVDGERRRRHWNTSQIYYRAFLTCTAEADGHPDGRALVARAGGPTSTFYTVAGPKAQHTLLARYRAALPSLAERYPTPSVAAWLGHETAVWAYWQHRTGWLRAISGQDRDRACRSLVIVLADFAAGQRDLMHALDWRPPICAVEDFAIVLGGGPSPENVYDPLARLLKAVAAAPGLPPEAAADSAERELDDLLRPAGSAAAQARLAEAVENVLSNPDISDERLMEIGKMLRSAGELLLGGSGRAGSSAA
ncbi:hypothetical protein [Nonomuraea typhae]|uniref:hypothetical protein n=1 Tax=Nonomuraea typhae TaxID=2603600 RepID=UPI0012F9F290|nr:hypothetical protein [Nonomuraea typhae]